MNSIDSEQIGQVARAWVCTLIEVSNGAFQGDGREALVFEVAAAKILAFAKGEFAQTRYRNYSMAGAVGTFRATCASGGMSVVRQKG